MTEMDRHDHSDRAGGPSASEQALVDALVQSQQLGFLGARPIVEVIEHARAFVDAVGELDDHATVIDLGAGGGTPGLVLAHDLPHLTLNLLDRRAKRTDFLERVVRRLGWNDRVTVTCADADDIATRRPHSCDVVVARGFGPPELTIRMASRLVRPGGHIVISEPPSGDRWDAMPLDRLGVTRCLRADSSVAVFVADSDPTPH